MPTHLVNLDALIQRDDFDTQSDTQAGKLGKEIRVDELELGRNYFQVLRKPDFQRETSNWDETRICEFIKSFLSGDLIPALIMWRSPRTGNVFVIDGAHRLSALMAWVHDDYGDGEISKPFFSDRIEPAQAT